MSTPHIPGTFEFHVHAADGTPILGNYNSGHDYGEKLNILRLLVASGRFTLDELGDLGADAFSAVTRVLRAAIGDVFHNESTGLNL